jgi:hypothetical protein
MVKSNSLKVQQSRARLEMKYHELIEWILAGNTISKVQSEWYNKREEECLKCLSKKE